MAHFAQLDDNNIVIHVMVISDEDAVDGENFCHNLLGGRWKQTSYNSAQGVHINPHTNQTDNIPALRKNYAGIGYTYDPVRDAFIPPRPFASWVLNETTCLWEPPIPMPNDATTVPYSWNETLQQWQRMNM